MASESMASRSPRRGAGTAAVCFACGSGDRSLIAAGSPPCAFTISHSFVSAAPDAMTACSCARASAGVGAFPPSTSISAVSASVTSV